MTPTDPRSEEHGRVGIAVSCTVCRRTKAPRGRSVSPVMYHDYCTMFNECPGYYEDPKPGDLWPGETCEEFGFAHTHDATRKVTT